MAAFDTTRPVAALNSGFISRFVSNVFGEVIAWNDARKTRNALSKLTARELDDIGLIPADISNIEAITR